MTLRGCVLLCGRRDIGNMVLRAKTLDPPNLDIVTPSRFRFVRFVSFFKLLVTFELELITKDPNGPSWNQRKGLLMNCIYVSQSNALELTWGESRLYINTYISPATRSYIFTVQLYFRSLNTSLETLLF